MFYILCSECIIFITCFVVITFFVFILMSEMSHNDNLTINTSFNNDTIDTTKSVLKTENITSNEFLKLQTEEKEDGNHNTVVSNLRTAQGVLKQLRPKTSISLSHTYEFHAIVEVDGKIFNGTGKTNFIALELAAEAALCHIFCEKIKFIASCTKLNNNFQYNTNSWKLLRSFAMFKLVKEWLLIYKSNDDYKSYFNYYMIINDLMNQMCNDEEKIFQNYNNKQKNDLSVIKVNPIVFLNRILRKNLNFKDSRNNTMFVCSLIIDETEYYGESFLSKKAARYNVAKNVLKKKFNINYL